MTAEQQIDSGKETYLTSKCMDVLNRSKALYETWLGMWMKRHGKHFRVDGSSEDVAAW